MRNRSLFSLETGTGAGDEGSGGTGEGSGSPTPGSQEGSAGSQEGTGEGDRHVPASELTKVRNEAANYRTQLRDAQKKIEELEGEKKGDIEKLSDRLGKLEGDNKTLVDTNRALRVQVLASKVGIIPEARSDAARLLDWGSVKDPDSDSDVEKALRELVKEKTFLLGKVPGGSDGGAGGTDRGSGDMNSLLRQAAGRS